jgi:hypothetical protein
MMKGGLPAPVGLIAPQEAAASRCALVSDERRLNSTEAGALCRQSNGRNLPLHFHIFFMASL